MTMPDATPPIRVLAIDDLQSIHEDYRKILAGTRPAGSAELDAEEAAIFGEAGPSEPSLTFSLTSAFDGAEGLAQVKSALEEGQPYAVALVDMRMPAGWDGVETIKRIWAADPDIQVVLCTAYSEHAWSETIQQLGQPDNLIVLKKPFDPIEVQQLAFALARKWLLAREVKRRLSRLDELVQKRTDELQAAEMRFSTAFNASPLVQCIQCLDNGTLLEVNQTFESYFATERAACVGQSIQALAGHLGLPEWPVLLERLRAGEKLEDVALRRARAGAEPRELRSSGRIMTINGRRCAIWVMRDITPQIALEAQLRQAQKMDAVGQLAAGIAHDFNNLLTVIDCYATELIDQETRPAPRTQLESVKAAAMRAAALTRQLLVFSRKQISQPEVLDIAGVLRELQPMLRRLISEEIALDWQIPAGVPPIVADVSGLEQILVNLVLNARDAIQSPGRITVSVSTGELTECAVTTQHAEARPGPYVAISVSDTGTGIAPEVLPRIFEPFFTTKKVGQGTGLGLATVYSVVRQHGGWVDVQTTVGRGSTFTVYHPAHRACPSQPAATPKTVVSSSAIAAARVLVVEDDTVLGSMLATILQSRGVTATVVSDGPEAIAAWRDQGPFEILVSDVVMPNGMNGLDVACALRQHDSELPVVLITGYSSEILQQQQRNIPGPAPRLVMKPFNIAGLIEAVLGARRTPDTSPAASAANDVRARTALVA